MLRRILLLLAFAGPAVAAPKPIDRPQAKAIYAKGVEAFQEGRHAEALKYFEAARALDPAPVLTYNIARAHEEMGQAEEAIAAYRRYLEESPEAEDRADVERRIRVMGAIVDKRPEPEPEEPPPAAPEPSVAEVTEVAEPSSLRAYAYGAGAAGIISLGVGVVFGVRMNQSVDDHRGATTGRTRQSTADQAESDATAANVAYGVGGALLLTGAVLWFLEPDVEPATALVPTAEGLLFQARF